MKTLHFTSNGKAPLGSSSKEVPSVMTYSQQLLVKPSKLLLLHLKTKNLQQRDSSTLGDFKRKNMLIQFNNSNRG